MAILINSAGTSTSDPALKGLSVEFVFAASSMDVATLTDAWLDQAAGFPGTNSVKSSLSPAATVLTAGNAGTYNDTTKQYVISSTTGLSAGDYLYLSHASLTAGVYKIATVVDGTHVTITSNPLNGSGNQTGVAYQVAWRYTATLGTAPLVSSSGGQINYFKVEVADSLGNTAQTSDTFYIRDAPSGSAYIAIQGVTYDGTGTVSTTSPTFALLAAWTARGGVSHLIFANHSTQSRNDFTWGDTTTTEKTLAAAVSSGLRTTAGDGTKYGRLLLRTTSGSSNTLGVDIAVVVDSTAPTVVLYLFGR